jgi:hypothetical protein
MNYPIAYVDWFLTITEELASDQLDLNEDDVAPMKPGEAVIFL